MRSGMKYLVKFGECVAVACVGMLIVAALSGALIASGAAMLLAASKGIALLDAIHPYAGVATTAAVLLGVFGINVGKYITRAEEEAGKVGE
tara:strand:- start:639 stop:911 length:273 start_codon:yes stop_codon:yes gene_type:complete